MYEDTPRQARVVAASTFDAAARRALIENILSKLSGKHATLLPFDDVLGVIGKTQPRRVKRDP